MIQKIFLSLLSFLFASGAVFANSSVELNYFDSNMNNEDLVHITVGELVTLLNSDPTACRYIIQKNNAWWIINTCNYCIDVYVDWQPDRLSECAQAPNNYRIQKYVEYYTRVSTRNCRPARTKENECR